MVESKYYCDICGKELKASELKIMSLDERLHDLCPNCYRNFKAYVEKARNKE